MDGQRSHGSANGSGNKSNAPGGNGLFSSSFLTQQQTPTSSTYTANSANAWAKNLFDQTTKNMFMPNMPNMFPSNMATNGSFSSTMDNAWQNPSTSQSNLNPFLAAIQQNYAKNANQMAAAPLNPLLGASSFDPRTIHPSPSSINPPIPQPKQPPKHPSGSGFQSIQQAPAALPTTSSYGSSPSLPSTTSVAPKLGAFNFPPGYDQLRNQINATLMSGPLGQLQQQFPQTTLPTSFNPSPSTPAAKQPLPGIPPQTFDHLMAAVKNPEISKHASGFNLSHILPSTSTPSLTQIPSTMPRMAPSQMPPSTVPSIFPPPQMPLTSSSSIFPSPLMSSKSPFSPPLAPMPTLTMSTAGPSTGTPSAHPTMPSSATPGSSTATPALLQIPSTSGLIIPSTPDGTLISPRPKRKSGGQNGDAAEDDVGLDLDMDLDLFDGMTQRDQEAILNSSINFDDLFTEADVPTSIAEEPPPPPLKPVVEEKKKEEPKKEEISSASLKMQRLMSRLNKNTQPTTLLTPVASVTPVTPAPVNTPPVIFHRPATPVEKSDRLTFTPPLSPVDYSDQPSTSGISNLITNSLIAPEAAKTDTTEKKKPLPVYLRGEQQDEESAPIPIFKAEPMLYDSKENKFEFTDSDPEDTGEKIFESSDSEAGSQSGASDENVDDEDGSDDDGESSDGSFDHIKEELCSEDEKAAEEENKQMERAIAERRLARQANQEFSEKLRKRRKDQINLSFASVQQSEHNNVCAIDSAIKSCEDEDKPPLPRLLIRLPKKSNGEERQRRKQKKRHYYEDEEETDEDSDDWYGGRPVKKKRGRKPKIELEPDETYSARLVDPSIIEHARREVQVQRIEYMSKKEKLMRSWREDNAGQEEPPSATGRGVEGRLEPKSLGKIVNEFKYAEARNRLDNFKHCGGFVPRGTFLVLKSEVNTDDCSLWKVDSSYLLQKFTAAWEQTEEDGPFKLVYKNSSTYSGWCEAQQSDFMIVEVKHVVNTRSETVVQPILPVRVLFPAIPEELRERCCLTGLKALINREDVPDQIDARNFILKDDIRNGLFMMIRAMLDGALSFDYFASEQTKENGEVTNHSIDLLHEIECQIRECESAIEERISFGFNLNDHLKRYTSCMSTQCDFSEIDCQACGEEQVERTLQLFDPKVEPDQKSVEVVIGDDESDDGLFDCHSSLGFLPAVDFLLCEECCKLAMWNHQLVHFRIDLEKRLEDRLLEGTLEMPSMLPEQIVGNLRECYSWMKEMIVPHTETWDLILESEDESGEDEVEVSVEEKPTEQSELTATVSAPVQEKDIVEPVVAADALASDALNQPNLGPAEVQVTGKPLLASALLQNQHLPQSLPIPLISVVPPDENVDEDDDLIDPVTL